MLQPITLYYVIDIQTNFDFMDSVSLLMLALAALDPDRCVMFITLIGYEL